MCLPILGSPFDSPSVAAFIYGSETPGVRCVALQMGEEADSFYIIEEGTVSVEASFVDIPLAQRAVSFPVNVASPSNGWCGLSLSCK